MSAFKPISSYNVFEGSPSRKGTKGLGSNLQNRTEVQFFVNDVSSGTPPDKASAQDEKYPELLQ